MEKKIGAYLGFYLGNQVQIKGISMRTHIIGVHTNGNIQVAHSYGSQDYWRAHDLVLILKPLKELSQEDANFLGFQETSRHYESLKLSEFVETFIQSKFMDPEEVVYLCKNGYDVFSLIEAGLAIPKKKPKLNISHGKRQRKT